MTTKNIHAITLRFDPTDLDRWKREARRRGLTLTAAIRQAMAAYLDSTPRHITIIIDDVEYVAQAVE